MDSDSDYSDTLDEETKALLNSIFGDTDDDEEDFEGFSEDAYFNDTKDKRSRFSPMDIEEYGSTEQMFSSDDESADDEDKDRLDEILQILESSDEELIHDFEGFTEEDLQDFNTKSDIENMETGNKEFTFIADKKEDNEVCQTFENKTPELPNDNAIHSTELKNRPQSDFDIMMSNRKKMRDRNKKVSRNIFECEDVILDVIDQMKAAAEDDKNLQKQKKLATKKLKTLPIVLPQLKKEDLKIHFCDMGLLDVVADWLMPTSDTVLPHLNIRNALINQLSDFSCIKKDHLRRSGIAAVLRRLLKHEKETRENKEKLRQLLSSWSRSVFNVKDNYYTLTERERDELAKIQNRNRRCSKETKLLEEPLYYMPGYQIPKKSKETFEKMLGKPEHTKSFREKLKRFGSSGRYYKF